MSEESTDRMKPDPAATFMELENNGVRLRTVSQSNAEATEGAALATRAVVVPATEGEQSQSASSGQASGPGDTPAYYIKEVIGEGGMGTVYRAESPNLKGSVALKVLNSGLVGDRVALRRFEKEAHAISQLTHANIVQVFGFAADRDDPYLVMEYVDGASLAEVLRHERTIPVERVIDWTLQICAAIQHAHEKGIVHRDLKPSNILVSDTASGEQIKLVDFGIAKLAPANGRLTELTQQGEVFGSPNYMSPEQCQGKPIDSRTDIYSLGCVLYEALSGKTLFVAENSIQILVQHVSSPITRQLKDLTKFGVPDSLVTVLSKMLEKNPDKRYQSANEVKAEFDRLKKGSSSLVWQKKFAVKATIAAAIIALLGLGVVTTSAIKNSTANPNPGLSTASSSPTDALNFFDNAESKLNRLAKAHQDNWAFITSSGRKDRAEEERRRKDLNDLTERTKRELQDMGPAAIPGLLASINVREVTGLACDVLGSLGAAAVEPTIDWARKHPRSENQLSSVIANIGKPAGDRLAELTKAPGTDRALAADLLAWRFKQRNGIFRRGDEKKFLSSTSQEYLVSAMNDEKESEVRNNLVMALQNVTEPTAKTTQAVCSVMLNDKDEDIRAAAATTLSQWLNSVSVDRSNQIAKQLCKALSADPAPDVRKVAALGLNGNKVPTPEVIACLRNAKHDESDAVRQAALTTLSNYAVNDSKLMPDLNEALKEPNRSTVWNALSAARQAGPRAASVVPTILLINDRDGGHNVARALTAIGSYSPEVIAVMLAKLAEPEDRGNWVNQRSVIEYFKNLGPKGQVAIPALKKIVERHGIEHYDAEQAIKQLSNPAAEY